MKDNEEIQMKTFLKNQNLVLTLIKKIPNPKKKKKLSVFAMIMKQRMKKM